MVKNFWLGMLVLGMIVVGCKDNNSTSQNESVVEGGICTLINIPSEYNGKYAYLEVEMDGKSCNNCAMFFLGGQSASIYGAERVLILNGSVSFPMWVLACEHPNYCDHCDCAFYENCNCYSTVERYYGNSTCIVGINGVQEVFVGLFNTYSGSTHLGGIWFDSITFVNGNATLNWNVGY